MTETLILSGFYAFTGFARPCDLRETITIPARTRRMGRPASVPRPWRGHLRRPEARQAAVDTGGLGCDGRSSRKRAPALARRGRSDQQYVGSWVIERQAANAAARRTRASANTSGPDFTVAWKPGEIAELERSAPNEENQFLLPDRFSMERLSSSKGRSSRLT